MALQCMPYDPAGVSEYFDALAEGEWSRLEATRQGRIKYAVHRKLVRVARPGAPILLSVMSLFGAMRLLCPLDAANVLETVNDHLDWSQVLSGTGVVLTKPESTEFHQPLALFSSAGLRAALVDVGLTVETFAAANPFLPEFLPVPKIAASEGASQTLIDLEVALCEASGLVDGGGHILAVARKPKPA